MPRNAPTGGDARSMASHSQRSDMASDATARIHAATPAKDAAIQSFVSMSPTIAGTMG